MSMLQQVPDPFALGTFDGVVPVTEAGSSVLGAPGFAAGPMAVDVQGLDADPNSPAAFANNIQVAHTMALRIQQLALSVISGIEQAYNNTSNPLQTAADLAALNGTLVSFNAFLVQTGVGGLPLSVPGPGEEPITEQHLLDKHEATMSALYARMMGPKDAASTVADVLNAPDRK